MAVDAATAESGCLQYMPGSYLHGVHPHSLAPGNYVEGLLPAQKDQQGQEDDTLHAADVDDRGAIFACLPAGGMNNGQIEEWNAWIPSA